MGILKEKAKLVVLTGASGAGKSDLEKKMLATIPDSGRLVTMTTRPPRDHEREGVHYFFTSIGDFERRRAEDEFIECKQHYGTWYGASRVKLHEALTSHSVVLAVLDVFGAVEYKRQLGDGCVTVFVDGGELDELRTRLKKRGESDEATDKRLQAAPTELEFRDRFDYRLMNRDGGFDRAAFELYSYLLRYLHARH